MPGVQEPIGKLWTGYTEDDSGWGEQVNANFYRIGALMQIAVISRIITAPPGLPADGDRYIVPTGATGAWTGKTDNIAVWRNSVGAWEFYAPANGWVANIMSETTWGTRSIFKTGSGWSPGTANA